MLCSVQMNVLYLSRAQGFSNWLAVFNFNILDSTNTCLIPLSPAQRLVTGVYLPLVCLGQFLLLMTLHAAAWQLSQVWVSMPDSLRAIMPARMSKLHKTPYIRTCQSALRVATVC